MSETKPKRGHEIRKCNFCGEQLHVHNSDARNGAGKYCSVACADQGRSWAPAILELLPCTASVVQEAFSTSYMYASHALRRMCDKGIAHIVGVVKNPNAELHGAESLVLTFAKGPQPNPNVPAHFRGALAYFADQLILAALPGTQSQLAERTGVPRATITKRLSIWRKVLNEDGEQTICFVSEYLRSDGGSPGPFISVWSRGPGRDVPCELAPINNREKYERWRDKLESSGRKTEIVAAKSEREKKKRIVKQRIREGDPFINAMFGTPAQRKQRQEAA